jgi:hypothetical protein
MRLNLKDSFVTGGNVKPGAFISTVIASGNSDIRESTDKDIAVFWGGANNVCNNNTSEGLKHIINFVQTNRHTNIILTSVPHRYDLPEWSCVNREVQTFKRKLTKLMKPFEHVSVVKLGLGRESCTRHGQHLNNRGKEKAALKIAQVVTTILHEQRNEPISLHWKNDLEEMKSQALREGRTKIKNIKTTVFDKEVAIPNAATHGESAEDIK